MKRFAWFFAAACLYGCSDSSPKVEPSKTAETKAKPAPVKRIVESNAIVPIVSTAGKFTIVPPAGWRGSDLTPAAISEMSKKLSEVTAPLGENYERQATALMNAQGTVIAFDIRPSKVKYGFADNLSGFTRPNTKEELEKLISEAKSLSSNAAEQKKFSTPLGSIYRIKVIQPSRTVSGYDYKVAHFVYLIMRPKRIHAIRFSTVSDKELILEPEFKKSIETIKFSE